MTKQPEPDQTAKLWTRIHVTEKSQSLLGLIPDPVARAEQDQNNERRQRFHWLVLAAFGCLILSIAYFDHLMQPFRRLSGILPQERPLLKPFALDSMSSLQKELEFQEQDQRPSMSAEAFRELELELPCLSSSPSFIFRETANHHGLSYLRHVKGNVSIEVAPETQTSAIKIDVSIRASSDQLAQSVYLETVDASSNNVAVEMGYTEHGHSEMERDRDSLDPNRGMSVCIKILVKQSVQFNAVTISTKNVDVLFTSSLWTKNLDDLVIETVSGKVGTSELIETDPRPSGSRRLYLRTNAGSITGSYPLADLLDIKSNVGSVEINVIPQYGSPYDKVTPAKLHAVSNAGLLALNYVFDEEQPEQIPDRVYMSNMTSNAGELRARLLHTKSTTFASAAGSMTLDVVPWRPREGVIETDTAAGSVSFRLGPEIGGHGRPLIGLAANHVTTAGSMELVYPEEWEGEFVCEILHGDCVVRGRDVHITKSGKNIFGGSEILGYKGSRNGTINVTSVSGGSRLIIGET